jgi:hypothetical protein
VPCAPFALNMIFVFSIMPLYFFRSLRRYSKVSRLVNDLSRISIISVFISIAARLLQSASLQRRFVPLPKRSGLITARIVVVATRV